MNRYEIWGIPVELRHMPPHILQSVEAEFSGAFLLCSDEPVHVFVHAGAERFCVEPVDRVIARHRGGSSGDKTLLDGTTFFAASQNRDVGVLSETAETGIYVSNGSVIITSATQTVIAGSIQDDHLVPDLIEAYVLHKARERGWMQCHAAGWLEGGGAALAIGDSGDGKTTRLLSALMSTSSKKSGVTFLGNDRVFLRIYDDQLQVRGYPLAMNIGCGTIRSLNLDLPQFGGADNAKVRLTPSDVGRFLDYDYSGWWPVKRILCKDESTLKANMYSLPDPCHPTWNIAWSRPLDSGLATCIEARALALTDFTTLIDKGRVAS